MGKLRLHPLRLLFAGLVVTGALVVAAPGALPANNSEQVVFSGIGTSGESPPLHVFGFWIWCEAESGNPYAGACQGAMYFYDLGVTTHVSGGVTEGPSGIYTMSVSNGSSVNCTLKNASAAILSGPNNEVDVSCSVVPRGGGGAVSVSGASTNAVVRVTGPE